LCVIVFFVLVLYDAVSLSMWRNKDVQRIMDVRRGIHYLLQLSSFLSSRSLSAHLLLGPSPFS